MAAGIYVNVGDDAACGQALGGVSGHGATIIELPEGRRIQPDAARGLTRKANLTAKPSWMPEPF